MIKQELFSFQTFFVVISLASVCLFSQCKNKPVSQKKSAFELAAPGPDACRVQAQVVEVFPPRQQEASTSICTQYSCEAKIKVLKIINTGHTFPANLLPGSETRANFRMTLAPSKKAFPESKFSLPGLIQGDVFECNLEAAARIGEAQSFEVSEYIKIN